MLCCGGCPIYCKTGSSANSPVMTTSVPEGRKHPSLRVPFHFRKALPNYFFHTYVVQRNSHSRGERRRLAFPGHFPLLSALLLCLFLQGDAAEKRMCVPGMLGQMEAMSQVFCVAPGRSLIPSPGDGKTV